MSQVKISHVFKRFGEVTAVNDFNIDIADGEFISFLGPSGCGKTTTLRMVAGFERASEGEIVIGDNVVSSSEKGIFVPPEKRGVGMVFQSYAVWPHMNVIDNVGYPLKIQNVPKEERLARVNEMLELVHLKEYGHRLPSELSGGQQQRVALARALVARPSLLLLDEPLSNLDAKLRESMRFEISQIQKKLGITVIYVTHDQSEAMALSDKILVMKLGVMQQIDTPLNIYNNPANKFVFSFIGVSSFTDVEWRGQQAFVKGANTPLPSGIIIPDRMKGEEVFNLASRPSTIKFTSASDEMAVPGQVIRKAFLGEIIDYLVRVGDQEIRVQIGRREPGPEAGEGCYIKFLRPFWYKANED